MTSNRLGAALTLAIAAALLAGPSLSATAADSGYAVITGTITRETGNPLGSATVILSEGGCGGDTQCGTQEVVKTTTDAHGTYRVRYPVDNGTIGSVRVVVAAKGAYSARTSTDMTIRGGTTYRKNLTVYTESMIVGRITDASGKPIDAVLRVYDAKTNKFMGLDSVRAKNGGYFRITLGTPSVTIKAHGRYKIKLYLGVNPGTAGSTPTSWYGAATKADATVVIVKSGKHVRVNPVFTP